MSRMAAMTRIGLFISFLSLLFTSATEAEEHPLFRADNMQLLTIEDGLPQNNVRCIEEDEYGFLWICTGGGLVRYDGYELETINKDYEGNALTNTRVRDIEIIDGIVWIGTEEGLNYFDLSTGLFHPTNEIFRKQFIYFIESNSTTIAIGTKEGLFLLDRKSSKFQQKVFIEGIKARDGVFNGTDIFVANYGYGILKVALKNGEVLNEFKAENSDNLFIDLNLSNSKIYAATYNSGSYILDLEFNDYQHIKICELGAECENSINNYFVDFIDGNSWVSTEDGLYDFYNKRLVKFTDYFTNKYATNQAIVLHKTNAHIFFGLNPGGLLVYKRPNKSIKVYNYIENITQDKSIYDITKHSDDIVLATYGGLYKIGKGGELSPLSENNTLLTNNLDKVHQLESYDNKLFIGNRYGLFKYEPHDNSIDKVSDFSDLVTVIRVIGRDVYVGFERFGLFKLITRGNKFKLIQVSTVNKVNDLAIKGDVFYLTMLSKFLKQTTFSCPSHTG